MKYLLDTNVVSELRRPKPHGAVLAWLSQLPDDAIGLSAVILGELQAGVEKLRLRNREKADQIESWVGRVEAAGNVVSATGRTFRIWAKLMQGKSETLLEDGLIAATAIEHGLVVATRNMRDFEVFGAPVFNPFHFAHQTKT